MTVVVLGFLGTLAGCRSIVRHQMLDDLVMKAVGSGAVTRAALRERLTDSHPRSVQRSVRRLLAQQELKEDGDTLGFA